MSSFRSTALLVTAAGILSLAGCGFKPLYGVDSASHQPAVAAQFAAIEIPPLADRRGQQMRNLLIDALHSSGAAEDYRYRLTVVIAESVLNLGLQQNSTSTRGQVRLTVKYALIEEKTGKNLLHETLRTSTGYNILINQFSSVLSQDDAEAQGLQQIANDMAQHIALYFATEKPADK
jgi:LPS-assembly lipoprotein